MSKASQQDEVPRVKQTARKRSRGRQHISHQLQNSTLQKRATQLQGFKGARFKQQRSEASDTHRFGSPYIGM